jgi:glycine cleavage system regulatory protein
MVRPARTEETPVKTTLVLTFTGADRPGLVDLLSETIVAHGGNWQQSRMACLAGRFVGIVELTVGPGTEAALSDALGGLGERGLQVHVDRGAEGPAPAGARTLRLELTGNDRPGILHDITHALATRGVNVDEMNTECVEAPMAGGLLFKVEALLHLPPGLGLEALRSELEDLAGEMMVDLQIEESKD